MFAGPGGSFSQNGGTKGTLGFHTYKIDLDTTSAQWTATWYRDSVQTGTTHTFTTNPTTIAYVGFGTIDEVGHVDNFSFSSSTPAVPEPSTTLLLGVAAVALRAFRTRKGEKGLDLPTLIRSRRKSRY